MPGKPLPLSDRLWARVQKTDGCWLWQGRLCDGYGELKNQHHFLKAHRVAWSLVNGPIPDGQQVLHRCDVRNCVRPDHLFLGTNHDNVMDREAKGRGRKALAAMNLARTKLSADQVLAIRRLYATGTTRTALAAQFNTPRSYIYSIISGRRRQSVSGEDK